MTLDIGRVLKGAANQTISRVGLIMMALYMVYAIIYQIGLNGLMGIWIQSLDLPTEAVPPRTIQAPTAVYAGLVVVGLLMGVYFSLVILRTFVAGERRTIPRWVFTRRPLWGMLNIFLGGLAFMLILFIGFILLVIPGVIAYIAFIFTVVFIAAEDVNFVSAFKQSWNLSRGNWLRIAVVLLVVVGLAALLAAVISTALSFGVALAGIARPMVTLGTLVVFAPVTIYIFAVITEMYTQLKAAESDDGDTMERL